MNEITAVITSLRNRARKLEEFAAELERLAVNEKLSDNLPINKVVIEPLTVTSPVPPPSPPSVRLAKPTKRNKTGRVLIHRGLRANVLRYLITGEASAVTIASIASAVTIARIVDAPFDKVKGVLLNLLHEGYVTQEIRTIGQAGNTKKYEVFLLTTKGKEEAQWFVDNPDIMIRNKQAIAASDRRINTGNPARPN